MIASQHRSMANYFTAYLFHIVPVMNDSMVNGVSQVKDIMFRLSLMAYVTIY